MTDEKELERTAYVSGSLKALAALIQKLVPPAETPWFEDEAEAMSLLLEVYFILSMPCMGVLTVIIIRDRQRLQQQPR